MMALINWSTLVTASRLSWRWLSSPKKRSTRFSHAVEFYESEAYRPHHERRLAGARNELVLVAGEDMTGAARAAE